MIKLTLFLSLLSSGVLPLEPLYLNNLCDGSDVIVVAQITNETIYESSDEVYIEATLVLDNQIKGRINEDSIKVRYNPLISCPEGPLLLKGANVLAFLKKENEEYSIYGLSHGTKYFDSQLLRDEYINRIYEYLKLSKNNIKDSLTVVDWLIDNLKYETTSIESLIIINNSISNEEYLLSERNMLPHFKKNVFPITRLWNENHKDILREKILDNTIDSKMYAWKLLCHLYIDGNVPFTNFMINKIPEYLEKEYYHGLKDIISTLKFRDEKLKNLQKLISELPSKRENHKKLSLLVAEFMERLKKN